MGNWPARHDLSCWLGRKTSTQTNKLSVFLCLHIKVNEHTDAFSKAQMLPFCGLARQKKPEYRKFPKYLDTKNICCNHSKIWTLWLYYSVMSPNDADGMANSVDPDQTAPLRAVWSGSALFAQSVRKLRIITVPRENYRSWTGDHYPPTHWYQESNLGRKGGKQGFYPCLSWP